MPLVRFQRLGLPGQNPKVRGGRIENLFRVLRDLGHHQISDVFHQVPAEGVQVLAGIDYFLNPIDQTGCVVGNQKVGERFQSALPDDAENGFNRSRCYLVTAESDDLIEQALRVAHTAGPVFGDRVKTPAVHFDAIVFAYQVQLPDDLLVRQGFEFKTLTARKNGFGNFVLFRGGENKNHF